ncbi:hypothetical protein DACRYDRAFT_24757, partial [Dacryopinax primogenitus]
MFTNLCPSRRSCKDYKYTIYCGSGDSENNMESRETQSGHLGRFWMNPGRRLTMVNQVHTDDCSESGMMPKHGRMPEDPYML